MKKLMIAAFAVAFSAVAQAATCTWNSGVLKQVDADGKWTSSKVAVTSFSATTYIYSDAECKTLIGQNTVTSLGFTGAASGTYKDANNPTVNLTVANDGTYYVKLFMEADFGNGATQTFQNNEAVAYTVPHQGNGSAKFDSLGIVNTALTTAQWSAVPEPTSGLLLLLGVAGLALRRKQK